MLFKLPWRWETHHYLLWFPITSTLAVTKFSSVRGAQWQAFPAVNIQNKSIEGNKESEFTGVVSKLPSVADLAHLGPHFEH